MINVGQLLIIALGGFYLLPFTLVASPRTFSDEGPRDQPLHACTVRCTSRSGQGPRPVRPRLPLAEARLGRKKWKLMHEKGYQE